MFEKVPPSTGYWLIASHGEEHLPAVYQQRGLSGAGKLISVRAGEQLRDLSIALFATARISGRVVDTAGRAISDAQVLPMSIRYQHGAGTLSSMKSPARTNRRGEYRLSGLPPGPLYLQVVISNASGSSDLLSWLPTGFAQLPRMESSGYPLSYFPGTSDGDAAQVLYLRAGEERGNVDIVASKVHTLRVRGSIVDARTGETIRFAQLCLMDARRRSENPSGSLYRTVAITDGRFDLRGVLPGTYDLVVESNSHRLVGHIVLEVKEDNIEGLLVPVRAGVDLSVRVSGEVSPGVQKIDISRARVTLKPQPPAAVGPPHIPAAATEALAFPPVAASRNNGLLVLRGIQPWRYSVEVSHPFDDAYVKSIRLGSVNVIARGLTVEGPFDEELDLVLAAPAGRIEGQVFDSKNMPADMLRVVLIPEQRERRDLYRNVWTDDAGRFEIRNLPPGDYRLFAWEFVDQDAWLDSDFLRLYEAKGIPVRLQEGSRRILNVVAIPPWF